MLSSSLWGNFVAIAVFNFDNWVLRYPEFSDVTQAQAQGAFDDSCVFFLDNTDLSRVTVPRRLALLGVLVCHLLQLTRGVGGVGPSPMVGRVSSVTEGSVSLSSDMPDMPFSAAWFMQTRYGAIYWQATAGLRAGFYVVGPLRPALSHHGLIL